MLGFSAISEAPVSYVAPSAGGGTPLPDTVVPSFTGTLAYTVTSTSILIDWSGTSSTDDVAVARREYRIGGTGPYTAATAAEEASKVHTFAGLAMGTVYLVEVRCVDTSENVSAPLSVQISTGVGTQPDVIPPSFTGSLAYSKSSTSITLDWSRTTSSDNVAVARREYRIGGSGAYTPASTAEEAIKQHTFTGLAPSTVHQLEVRCVDTSNNVSQPLVVVVTTSAAPPAGGGGWNYIRYELVTSGHVPHLYLATVDWSLFAQLSPRNFGAPIAQGSHSMDSGSALLEIAVPAAMVPAGWYFLVLSDADGSTTLACPVLVVS